MKKLLLKISVFWEAIHSFVFGFLATILIILFSIGIVHNLLKINEMSGKYTGPYKNLVKIAETTLLNVYEQGSGSETVLIMNGFGVQSPVLFYKDLATKLNNAGYRVIIVEPLGYGFSTSAKSERTNSNITSEIHNALVEGGVVGPYILMPHSIGNVYAINYLKEYPNDVSKVVSIDGILPNMINEGAYERDLSDNRINVLLTSIAGVTGFERIMTYTNPDKFYINYMKDNPVYDMDDIDLYRSQIALNYLNNSMVKEQNQLVSNLKELKDYKYPNYIPVVEIISSETEEDFKTRVKENGYTNDYVHYAEDLLTNSSFQYIKKVEGDHMLPITNPSKIVEVMNEGFKTF